MGFGRNEMGEAGVQSISTLRTRAPSFASNAARGRPTTSDLFRQYRLTKEVRSNPPVNDGDDLPSRPIPVLEHLVVHAKMFEHFDDSQRRTRQD